MAALISLNILIISCSKGGCDKPRYIDEYNVGFDPPHEGKIKVKLLQQGYSYEGSDCELRDTEQLVRDAKINLTFCYFGMPASTETGCSFLDSEKKETTSNGMVETGVNDTRYSIIFGQAVAPEYKNADGFGSASASGDLTRSCGQSLNHQERIAVAEKRRSLCKEKAK